MKSILFILFAFIADSVKSQDNNMFDLQNHLQKIKAGQKTQLQKMEARNNLYGYRFFLLSWENQLNNKNEISTPLGQIPNMKVQQPTLGIIPNLKVNPEKSGIIPNAYIPKKVFPVK